MAWLSVAFFFTAAIYSAVGFGGGSTYTALLALSGTDYRIVPVVSLLCNIVVVGTGTLSFSRAGWLHRDLILPLTIASVPMAWLGGATPVGRASFLLILGLTLTASGSLLLLGLPTIDATEESPPRPLLLWTVGPIAGAILGYFSGLVGIGGGIFLAPALHLSGIISAKKIAATASFFILVNSIAGLIGQGAKFSRQLESVDLLPLGWLVLAVLVGGRIGNRAAIERLSATTVRKLTGALVLFVGLRLLWSWAQI